MMLPGIEQESIKKESIRILDLEASYDLVSRLTVGECAVILRALGYEGFTFDGYGRPSMVVREILIDDRVRDIPACKYKARFYGGPHFLGEHTRLYKTSFAALTADKMLRSMYLLGSRFVSKAINTAMYEMGYQRGQKLKGP